MSLLTPLGALAEFTMQELWDEWIQSWPYILFMSFLLLLLLTRLTELAHHSGMVIFGHSECLLDLKQVKRNYFALRGGLMDTARYVVNNSHDQDHFYLEAERMPT